jgi:eukaryotic-like serine/threonine-protein kinase
VVELRRAVRFALYAWPAFLLIDVFAVLAIGDLDLGVAVAVRTAGLVALAIAYVVLRMRPPRSSFALRSFEVVLLGGLVALTAVLSAHDRGLESSLVLGAVVVVLARGVLLPDPWRAAFPSLAAAVLAYPIVVAVHAFFDDGIAAQLGDREAAFTFALNFFYLVGAAVVSLFGGQTVWRLRNLAAPERSMGRYRLHKKIGSGAWGEVWKARDRALRRDVAVKILHADRATDQTAIARFEREAQATSELQHANTVRVYDYGVTEGGTFYYVMELLEGETLEAFIERGIPAPEHAAELMVGVCHAVAEAHRLGIVHRDIKPQNLFVIARGGTHELKVLDFGIAQLAGRSADDATLTQTGVVLGTPLYMAPEVAQGSRAGPEADVYSLAAVLYELLCGRPPFAGSNVSETLRLKLSGAPAAPSELVARDVPHRIERLAMLNLDADPTRRFANAAILADALEQALAASRAGAEFAADATTQVSEDIDLGPRSEPAPSTDTDEMDTDYLAGRK